MDNTELLIDVDITPSTEELKTELLEKRYEKSEYGCLLFTFLVAIFLADLAVFVLGCYYYGNDHPLWTKICIGIGAPAGIVSIVAFFGVCQNNPLYNPTGGVITGDTNALSSLNNL